MNNINKLEEGVRVCVSVKALFDCFIEEEYSNGCLEISNGYIEKFSEGRQTYYDLYNNHGELACMDGEIVLISSINKQRDTVTLINNNGEYPITFELYAEEIEEALFINVCDIKQKDYQLYRQRNNDFKWKGMNEIL